VGTKDSCWSVGMVYDPIGLLGVRSACGLRVATWHMAYDDTRHTTMTKRGGSWLGVDQQGRLSFKRMDCDISARWIV
jgi:hypothetical protein